MKLVWIDSAVYRLSKFAALDGDCIHWCTKLVEEGVWGSWEVKQVGEQWILKQQQYS